MPPFFYLFSATVGHIGCSAFVCARYCGLGRRTLSLGFFRFPPSDSLHAFLFLRWRAERRVAVAKCRYWRDPHVFRPISCYVIALHPVKLSTCPDRASRALRMFFRVWTLISLSASSLIRPVFCCQLSRYHYNDQNPCDRLAFLNRIAGITK